MLDLLEANGLGDVGVEIFYDALPFYDNANIVRTLRHHIERGQVSFHYPMDGVALLDDGWQYEYALDRLEECLHTAHLCGADSMVIHASHYGAYDRPERDGELRQRWIDRYPAWAALAAEYGVALWVENCGNIHDHGELFDQEAFLALFDRFPDMDALIDTGHATNCGWDLSDVTQRLGGRLKAYHLHSNNGKEDNHWPLRRGNFDVDGFFASCNRDALMIVEYGRWLFDDLRFIVDELNWLRSEYGL
jgi:sugar phosphate isomerase/epimerase